VATFDIQPLRTDFIKALIGSYLKNNWDSFILIYGTHFIYDCVVGGRMSLLQSMAYYDYQDF
jgi:hypothetical protein